MKSPALWGIQTYFVLFSFLIPIQRAYFHVPQMALQGFFPTNLCPSRDSNSQTSELHQPKTFWRTLYRLSYRAAAKPMPSWLLGVSSSTVLQPLPTKFSTSWRDRKVNETFWSQTVHPPQVSVVPLPALTYLHLGGFAKTAGRQKIGSSQKLAPKTIPP